MNIKTSLKITKTQSGNQRKDKQLLENDFFFIEHHMENGHSPSY